ncbi:MAG: biotin--[acetyl-CoA-carboxylase] ligase [Planctomycetes bacterium]|nr:biotin--[acetyl-CoA-carboxylase] ligase [Planctomycetota bacterium]
MSSAEPSWLHQLTSCDSTNTWALEHLEVLEHGACVWTQAQSAGRGQAGRSWVSDPGVLTASFIIKPQHEPDVTLLSLCAGLAVAHCVEDYTPDIQVAIKWPNDCFVHGRKIAGILCEGKRHAGDPYMVIGIGLNIKPQWSADAQQAPPESFFNGRPPISISELSANPVMLELITSLRQYLLESTAMIENKRWLDIIPSLRERDCLLGQNIEILKDDGAIPGIAAGIDDDGALLVQLADGGSICCTSSHNLRILDVVHE